MAISEQLALTALMGVLLVAVVVWITRVENWRSYTPLAGGGAMGDESGYVSEEKPGGLIRWLTTVDHKDIGILYGVYSIIAFVVGGVMVTAMRVELTAPEATLIQPGFYNSLLTSHGITMLFLFATPVIFAVANYFIPLLIGADDMAFPRINAIAFWLLPPAAIMIWSGFLPIPNLIPAQTGWTMYTPLSIGTASQAQANPGVDLMLLGLHLSGVSATMGAINFIATIFSERSDEVTWANLDIFSWTMLTQSGLILFAFPLLGSTLLMLVADRNIGTSFFVGDPILWQHLFWFFGHPEVYIIVLPPMGIISYVLPRFAGRKLFGFKFVVYSTLAIGVLSFGVWAHHMFTTGMDPRLRASFMAVSMAIAIPSAVKTFNWITTMWNGRVRLTTPMLFCIGFISNFIIGGVTGVFLASIPLDLVLHDTYYVVGHFHYIVFGAIAFAAIAGIYYWFPLFTGRWYQARLGKWHFWLWMIGGNITFLTMILLGYGGMPRRYATYLPQFASLNQLATVGALMIFVGGCIFLYNVVVSWLEGPRITDGDPWNLARDGVLTAEWQWFDRKLETQIADGGQEVDEQNALTDGGSDDADADADD